MLVHQYIHQLNNSELGRTGVHETYVSVPRGMVPNLYFVKEGTSSVVFKRSGCAYQLMFKRYRNGEFRLTGLGKLYREAGVEAGDLVVLEESNDSLWIDFIYRKNVIVFGAREGHLFECRNEDRLLGLREKTFRCMMNGSVVTLNIASKGKVRPRQDSLREVCVFQICADKTPLVGSRNQAFNLFRIGKYWFWGPSTPDVVRKLEWSDYE